MTHDQQCGKIPPPAVRTEQGNGSFLLAYRDHCLLCMAGCGEEACLLGGEDGVAYAGGERGRVMEHQILLDEASG